MQGNEREEIKENARTCRGQEVEMTGKQGEMNGNEGKWSGKD